jgi:hypothetical protein
MKKLIGLLFMASMAYVVADPQGIEFHFASDKPCACGQQCGVIPRCPGGRPCPFIAQPGICNHKGQCCTVIIPEGLKAQSPDVICYRCYNRVPIPSVT